MGVSIKSIEKGNFMKTLTTACIAIALTVQATSLYADHHLEDAPLSSGAMTILNLTADDPSAYTELQKGNAEIYEAMDVLTAGACVAVSGNESIGEMQVFSFHSDLASAFNQWDVMATSPAIKDLQTDLRASRTLTGNQTLQIVKGYGYKGELYTNWATRTVEVNPTNPGAYLQAVKTLGMAYKENGFTDVEFNVYQPIASGVSGSYTVIAVAPSLRRLGEAFDALSNEQWAKDAYSFVTASRAAPVSDKAYRCEQVYSSL
jgi:hypothetical protein